MLLVYTLYQCSFIFVSLASYCSVYCELLLCTSMPCVSYMSILCFYVDTIHTLCADIIYLMNVAIVLVLVCM